MATYPVKIQSAKDRSCASFTDCIDLLTFILPPTSVSEDGHQTESARELRMVAAVPLGTGLLCR